MVLEFELNDIWVEFIVDYVIKMFKIKLDKWFKMYSVEDIR